MMLELRFLHITFDIKNLELPLSQPVLPAMPNGGVGISTDEQVPRRLRSQGNRKDVFAMVKANMADTILSQPPLLVYPESLLGATENFWNRVNTTDDVLQQSLDCSRVDELQQLSDQIGRDFPHMSRTIQYYKTLMNPQRPRKPYVQLQFVQAGPQASARVGDVLLGEKPLPPRAHRLEVVFHHRR